MRRRENGRERGKEGEVGKERGRKRDHQMRHPKSLAVNTWGPVFKATI